MNKKQVITDKVKLRLLRVELKVEKQKLLEAIQFNESLISSIGDGVIIVNEYGIIARVNDSALKMLGYRRKELIKTWLPKVLPSKDKDGNDIPIAERPAVKALLSGLPTNEITSYIRKDGSLFPVSGTAAPFLFNSKPRGAIIVFRDFSIEQAVNRAKDEFVSLASHQLRTPLTSIMLYTQMIKDDENNNLNEELSGHLSKIGASTISMMELVGDFLNIAKLELGHIELNQNEADLLTIIDRQLDNIEAVIYDNKVKLEYTKPNKPFFLETDVQLLGEVMHNLFTNSIRYRSSQNPKLKVRVANKKDFYHISVEDNGIGIPEASKDRIFERLFRADNAKEVHSEGTGLGLYLVKKIVETLGGKIWFESKENIGTTFFVDIPKRN